MDLEELKEVEEAVVWADQVRAGMLRRTGVDVEFVYDADYQGAPVATTLPVRAEPYGPGRPGAVPPFFAGLLPEGRRLTALRRAIKTSADDDLSLLLAVGGDVVGHVRVLAPGETPADEAPESLGPPEEVRFAEVFARVVGHEPEDRVGLPGVQDKVSGRMISLPVAHRDARWILKLDPPEFRHLVANEAFFLGAARASGLVVPEHRVIHDADGAPGLLIRRFDRDGDGRVAVEDGCQVAGRYPADKYRLTTEQVVAGLAGVCGAPVVAARDLFAQLVFAFLTCNGDAHAKNLSVVRRRGEWRVSPTYDVPSSHPYGDTTLALSVGGRNREDLGRGDYLALAGAVGVRAKAAARVIDGLVDAADGWLESLETLPFDGRRVHKLRKAIEYRRRRLRG